MSFKTSEMRILFIHDLPEKQNKWICEGRFLKLFADKNNYFSSIFLAST